LEDGGGRTRFGIAEKYNPGLPSNFYTAPSAIALVDAWAIYKKTYWDRFRGDEINDEGVSSCLLSFSINDGEAREVKMLQDCLGLVQDGVVGPITLEHVNAFNGPQLAAALRAAQADWYRAVAVANPSKEKFLKGWLIRAARVYPNL
jgi:lysozyme family protein